jgi:hypothetical protein
MITQSIISFNANRDKMPTDKELKQFQLERYQRMFEIPRDDKHKSYLRKEISRLKKELKSN